MTHFVALAAAGFVFLSGMPAMAQAADASALWRGAVAAFGRGTTQVPATIDFLVEELGADGSVASYEKGRTTKRADGSTMVVFAEKNGRDTTAEYRKRVESKGGDGSSAKPPKGVDATPFDPAWQFAVRIQGAAARGDFVEIPYAIVSKDVNIAGFARFSNEGLPLLATQRWIKAPPFVSSMASTIDYVTRDDALLVARLSIDARIDALIIRKTLRFSMAFSDWKTHSP